MGELLVPLYLLKLAKQREAQALKKLSKFSLVIKFVHGKYQIPKLSLSALADHIEEIAHSFGRIGDRHIFKELNSVEEVLITSQTYVLSSPQSDTGTQQINQGMVTIYTSPNKTISSLSTSFLIASN